MSTTTAELKKKSGHGGTRAGSGRPYSREAIHIIRVGPSVLKTLRGKRLLTLFVIEDGSDGRPHLCKMLAKPQPVLPRDLIKAVAAAEAKEAAKTTKLQQAIP